MKLKSYYEIWTFWSILSLKMIQFYSWYLRSTISVFGTWPLAAPVPWRWWCKPNETCTTLLKVHGHKLIWINVILCGLYCHQRKQLAKGSEKNLVYCHPGDDASHPLLCCLVLTAENAEILTYAGSSTAARSCAWRKIMRARCEWRQFEWGNTQIKLMK